MLSVNELLFLSLTVEALQGKICQNSLPSEGVGQFEPRFQGKGRPPANTPCLKNVPPLACYNFDAHECILIFFGRNVTDKVGNQRCFTMPPQITSSSALSGKTGKYKNRIFHSNAV